MMILMIILALGLSLLTTPCEIGRPLSHWKEGQLEIHHINTGRGDATFFIFPD